MGYGGRWRWRRGSPHRGQRRKKNNKKKKDGNKEKREGGRGESCVAYGVWEHIIAFIHDSEPSHEATSFADGSLSGLN